MYKKIKKISLAIILVLVATVFVVLVLIVLMILFKSNQAISTNVFAIPNRSSFVGLSNYIKGYLSSL